MERKPFNKFSKFSKFAKKKDLKALKAKRKSAGMGFFRKRACKFCAEKLEGLDYKDVARLQKFISERGKILPARLSSLCAKHQRVLARAIKRARHIALLPFSARY